MFFHVIIVTWDLLSCSLTLPYPESPVQEAHHFLEYVPYGYFLYHAVLWDPAVSYQPLPLGLLPPVLLL